jgi:hypothetical protein
MRSAHVTLLSLIALTTGIACSTLKVSSDWDAEVDFSKIQTYAWIGQDSGVQGFGGEGSLLDQRIRKAVHETLATKGFSEVDRKEADVLVSYHINVENKLDVQTIQRGYGYGYGGGGRYRSYGGGAGYSDTYVTEYEEGTFLLDLVEPNRMELVWRGSAQSRITQQSTPEKREERVREVVGKVLAQYPPEP